MRNFKCAKCKQIFEETPANFGGVTEKGDSLCLKHWNEYIQIVNSHVKQLADWWASK